MTDIKLNCDDAIIVLGDFQEGIVELSKTSPTETLRRACWGMARLAEIFDIPTIATRIPKHGGGEANLIPEITETRSKLTRVRRSVPDSFENADFVRAVEATGRRTLVVGGIASEICVHWIVLSGLARGYEVYVIVDACGGLSDRSEVAAFSRFEAAGAKMSSVVSLAGEISGDFTQGAGFEAIDVVRVMMGQAW